MSKVKTRLVRLSYVTLAEAKPDMQGNKFYSTQILIDKNDKETVKAFQDAVEELKRDPKALAKVNNNAKAITVPFRDGDTDTADYVVNAPDVYAGKYFVNAKNSKRPQILGVNKEVLEPFEVEDEVYSGCYAQCILGLYVYNSNGNKGVGVGLNGVRKVKDGDRLGGVTVSADDFDDDLVDDGSDIL
ncbi:MAG: DUF2815 family protein [Veillonella sp.]|uniref:DUF2815 family protein n=1 Tax=Veillonella sp. TaxID=1926307 RepID=UPI0025FB74D2|nr:DUF2815 family protein [Veillonella sp.]MBE6079863.1 DUF2815 family protein [Veillonella sp.]